MSSVHEVEDKYEVDAGFTIPDFAGAGPVVSVSAPHVDDLEAVYFDTADYRLARNKITLRRRTGGPDAGWHLKLPAAVGREEIHRPLGTAEQVPKDLSGLVLARTRGQALVPVARLQTRRTARDLFDAAGCLLAEVADDEVRAQVLDPAGHEVQLSAWREVEVELVTGSSDTLEHAGGRLRKAGATPSTRPSKLAGVLGDRLSAGPDVVSFEGRIGKGTAAGAVIQAYLAEQLQTLLAADIRVRLDGPESIHDMRVATRRLRSAMGSYRRLLDEARARSLEERLRSLAAELGVVRDNEVMLERLLAAVAAQPQLLILGPVQRRLREELHGASLKGRTQLLEAMTGRDYAHLIDDLLDFVAGGVNADGLARQPAEVVFPKLVRRCYRRMAHRAELAAALVGAEQELALHQTRKSAKTLRYAAEAVEPVFGPAATSLAKQAEVVQEVLGEHQNSVMAAATLRHLAILTRSHPDESAFTFGVLAGVEQARGQAARSEFQRVWTEASRQRYREWLR